MRATLDLLGKVFQFRSCQGAEPGRRSGSPCLDYYIKRCGAPCVGYVTKEEYREAIDGVVAFLSGRYREIERDLEERMKAAAAAQEYEQAALERNRLQAVRSLLQRQRVANDAVGTLDAVARRGRRDGRERAGLPGPRRRALRPPVLLPRERRRAGLGRPRSSSSLQYYAERPAIPAQVIVQPEVDEDGARDARASRWPSAAAAPSRSAPPSAATSAASSSSPSATRRLALDQEKLKAERSRQQRVEALDELQAALALDALPLRIECFDISNLMGTNTVASMVVFEGGAPKKSDYRRFTIRALAEGESDDFAAMAEVLSRRMRAVGDPAGPRPHDPDVDASFATLPNLIVIDGGKGQLAAGLEALARASASAASPSSRSPSGSRRCSCRAGPRPLVLAHDTPALQLLQRVRDEAHRFAITHHRSRRDKAMTASVLDGFPGHRPGAQARAAHALRLARGGPGRRPRGARGRSGAAAEGRRASFTRFCSTADVVDCLP